MDLGGILCAGEVGCGWRTHLAQVSPEGGTGWISTAGEACPLSLGGEIRDTPAVPACDF